MPSQTWILDGSCARLQLPGLTGHIDCARPGDGLTGLVVQGCPCGEARLLGIAGAALVVRASRLLMAAGTAAPQKAAGTRVDWHVRGDDLVAAYEIGQPDAARIDVSWHASAPRGGDAWFARIDLVVSVRTERLDWRHDISVEGEVPAAVARQGPPGRAGCLLFCSERWIYAEFVHPADLRREEVCAAPHGPVRTRVRRHLFPPDALEKGVILRARARGLFLPAAVAPTTVEACYAEFAAADPPLSS